MSLLVSCEACGKKCKVADNLAGRKIKCPSCAAVFRVPPPGDPGPAPGQAPALEKPPAKTAGAGREGWKDHGSGQLPEDADFFAEPPPEIGEVLSAYTTRRQGQRPWPAWAFTLTILTSLGLMVAGPVVGFTAMENAVGTIVCMVAGLGGGGLLGILAISRFSLQCSYVGRKGVAKFYCTGSQEKIRREGFLFKEGAELFINVEIFYRNGMYDSTTYVYEWKDGQGKVIYTLRGNYRSQENAPESTHDYHFARAADFAWTAHLLPAARKRLEQGKAVRFNQKKNRWVAVGKGTITFCNGKEEETWDAEEIGTVDLLQDQISFRLKGVKRGLIFNSDGEYKFRLSHLANPQLFFVLVAEELGFKFS